MSFAGVLPGAVPEVFAFHVSGIVDFSYTDMTQKTGGISVSDSFWTQNYHLNISHYLLDPRVIRYSAGVGYSMLTSDTRPDSDTLTYTLNLSLLPGMMFSGSFYAQNNEQTIENPAAPGAADLNVETTSYGGLLSLRLNSTQPGNNNNRRYWNNNNNNNNNGSAMQFIRRYMPDIAVGYDHTESESLNSATVFHETRDRANAEVRYRLNNTFDFSASTSVEEYEDLTRSQKYDIASNYLAANVRMSPTAVLRLNGSVSDRTYENYFYAGERTEKTSQYSAGLIFGERERFSHEYSYSYSDSKADSVPSPAEGSQQQAKANLRYRLTDTIRANGGVFYEAKEYRRDPDPAMPGDVGFNESLNAAGLHAGISYAQQVSTASLGTWNLSSGYSGSFGSNDFGNELDAASSGNGQFYSNSVSLGVGTGWGKEDISAAYAYLSHRDDSPLNNDFWSSSVSLRINTTRIPRTRMQGSASYVVQDYTAEGGALFLQLPSVLAGSMQQQFRRAVVYDITIDYRVNSYLLLNAGANRGKSASKYTLSTQVPTEALVDDSTVHGGLDFSYPLARNLAFLANLSKEMRTANLSNTTVENDRVTTSLSYRLRKIFMSAEYRWMKSQPENSASWVSERIYFSLQRPF